MSRGRFSVVAVALLLALVWSARTATQSAPPAAPAAGVRPGSEEGQSGVRGVSDTTLTPATFVGAQACESCHREVYDTWKGGRHSKMLQAATPASVKGDFSVSELGLKGGPYQLRMDNGQYFITESFLTGRPWEHRVEYTLGSRRIQHYLTTIDNGRIVILPPSWDVQRREWFHNMEIVRPDEDEQKPIQQWNKNCYSCHVSQQENHYNPATHTYATEWADFGTSCERCHGPGSTHVDTHSRAKDPALVADRGIIRPTRLDPKTSSMICAQCHTLRDIVATGYTAGSNYYDYYLPLLEYGPRKDTDAAYWADGRPRRFSNDAMGLWQSECFLRGGVTCTNCHRDPHEPDIDKNPQLAATNNTLCVRCHQEIGAKLTAHTRHRANSTGSSCVECHMPKTVTAVKSTMRDHTIGVPAPENTVAFGIPNACTECHSDKPPAWAVDTLAKWWPGGRRAKLVNRAQTFTAARASRPEALDRLLAMAADDKQGPLVRANAAGYLANYQDQRAVAALLTAAKSDQPPIRAAALSSLGRVDIASSRTALLAALDDPFRAVRLQAFMALFNRGAGPFNARDQVSVNRVAEEFVARARLHEDDADSQRNLGLMRFLMGEFDKSADALQIAVDLEPNGASSKYLLGLARLSQRRFDDARALFLQVPVSDPAYHIAQERLKQIDAQNKK